MKKLLNIFNLLLLFVVTGCSMTTERQGVDVKKASVANSTLGVAYLTRGKYDIAMRKLKKAIEYDDENANAHHYIAELYRRLKENELAEEHFEEAMDLAEKDYSIKNNYGIFLCGVDSYDKGMSLLKSVLSDPLYNNKDQVYENMGLCSQKQGNLKNAKNYFVKALKMNANLPGALLGLAQIEFDGQRIKSAASYYNRHNKISGHTAQSLWLGVLIERKKGNKGRSGSYGVLLKGKFPDSEEARLLKQLERRRRR